MVTQQEIVDLMKNGWKLSVGTVYCMTLCMLRKGKEIKNVSFSSVDALRKKGVIESIPHKATDSMFLTQYRLTGKTDKVPSLKRVLQVYHYNQSIRDGKYDDVYFYTLAKSLNQAVDKFMQVPLIERYGSRNWIRERTTEIGDREGITDISTVYMLDDKTRQVLKTFKVKP